MSQIWTSLLNHMKTKLTLLLLCFCSSVFSQTYVCSPYKRDGVYDYTSTFVRKGDILETWQKYNKKDLLLKYNIIHESNSSICGISNIKDTVSVIFFDLSKMEWSGQTMNHHTLRGGKVLDKKVVPSFGKLKIIQYRNSENHQGLDSYQNRIDYHTSKLGSKSSWRSLEQGMTKTQVRKLIGEPNKIMNLITMESWSYDNYGKITFMGSDGLMGWTEPSKFHNEN